MDLCTVANKKYIKNAINLANSYSVNSYNKNKYIYCFDMSEEEIKNLQSSYQSFIFLHIPKVCHYAYDPTTFFYKVYAIKDCYGRSDSFIYSDSTNVFNRFVDIQEYMDDGCLFLPYNDERLANKYWTTKQCFAKMQAKYAENTMQYWAGFQCYNKSEENTLFIDELYKYMLDEEVALPNVLIKKPDGPNEKCIEHRQDQSVLSILINKYLKDQKFDVKKQALFGDWQTFKYFNPNYKHDLVNCSLSSRESKFGLFRFINE